MMHALTCADTITNLPAAKAASAGCTPGKVDACVVANVMHAHLLFQDHVFVLHPLPCLQLHLQQRYHSASKRKIFPILQ